MRLLFASLLLSTLGALPSGARADAPRVAIVVQGDPAASLIDAASRLEAQLAANPAELVLPADPLVRAALRGAEASPDDGLDAMRGYRRRLGVGEQADDQALGAIGAQLELVAIVVIRGADGPAARVYDVGEARYFAGEAALDEASVETTQEFVLARARAAARRREAPTVPTASETAQAATEAPAAAPVDPTAPVDQPPRRRWIRRNWPFIVAGALLIGTTTFFLVQRGNDHESAPVIHVRPGGN